MTLPRVILSMGVLGVSALTCAAGEPVSVQGEAQPLSLAQRWTTRAVTTSVSDDMLPPAFAQALRKYCSTFADPEAKRADVSNKMKHAPICFSANGTPEDLERLMRLYDLLPPTMVGQSSDERFWTDSTVFNGAGNVIGGGSGRAQAAQLTFSFPADGVTWGTGSGFGTGPNVLASKLALFFGAGNTDRARELIRQCFGSWKRSSGLTYTEVADDNTAESTGTGRNANRGDVRVGSYSLDGANNVLAYNNFTSSGSDMNIDADDFTGGNFLSATTNYRFIRDTLSHEHGHGLAMIHSIPCTATKLMEPFISTAYDMVQIDDMRGAQRNFGDRFAGNNAAGTARDFGNLTTPILHSVIEQDLSTNGTAGFNGTSADWFKFTISSSQSITISAAPTGGSYSAGQQSSSCSGTQQTINASNAGNLNIELRDAAGTTVLQTAASAAAGATETLSAGTLAAGTYMVRVFDVGPNTSTDQFVQLYNLTIRVGTSKALPQASAGVNKRIGQGFPCWFRGDLLSRATDGAVISTYQWDFENDGIFDASGGEVSTTYNTTGLRTVKLRVTDSNGQFKDDTITVDVFSAVAPPPPGAFNLLTPANGSSSTNTTPLFSWSAASSTDNYLFTLDDNSDFSSPIVSNLSTTSTSLSLSPGTVTQGHTYYWKVVAVNSFGQTSGTPNPAFFIITTPPPDCQGDLNGDGQRNTIDLTLLLGNFGLSVPPGSLGDLNNDGQVNTVDLTLLLGSFGIPC